LKFGHMLMAREFSVSVVAQNLSFKISVNIFLPKLALSIKKQNIFIAILD